MQIPGKYSDYNCQDYFLSRKFRAGVYSEVEQLWLIIPIREVRENRGINFLVIGRPGLDGIEFGYRKNEKGLWAYYPLENEFRLLAQDLEELVSGWLDGNIFV